MGNEKSFKSTYAKRKMFFYAYRSRLTVKPLLRYVDALFCTRGVLRSAIDPVKTKPIVLRVSGCTSMVGKDLANEEITTSIDDIIRVNASAVGVSVFIGSEYEKQTLKNLTTLVNECEQL